MLRHAAVSDRLRHGWNRGERASLGDGGTPMRTRQHPSIAPWLAAAVVGLVLGALAALSALGPLFIGLHLAICEAQARRFRKVARLEDLVSAGAPLGDALGRLQAARARLEEAGAERGLVYLGDGFYFDERDGRGRDLNLRLAYLFVSCQQLGYDFDLAVRQWTLTMAARDVARLAALLFVGAVTLALLYEPPGVDLLGGGAPPFDPLRLAGSGAALVAGFGGMRLLSRSAAEALMERLSEVSAGDAGARAVAA